MTDSDHRLSLSDLTALLTRIFERHGCSPEVAAILAANCASAQRDGADSHGVRPLHNPPEAQQTMFQ